MARKRRLSMPVVVLSIVVLMGLALLVSGAAQFAIGDLPPTVWLPNYANGRCGSTSDRAVLEFDMSDAAIYDEGWVADDHIKEFGCDWNTPRCSLRYKFGSTIGTFKAFRCEADAVYPRDSDKCIQLQKYGTFSSMPEKNTWHDLGFYDEHPDERANTHKIVIIASDRIGKLNKGDLVVQIRANVYNLESVTDRNLATTGVGTCNIDYMHKDFTFTKQTINDMFAKGDISKDNVIPFGRSFSYIASASKVEGELRRDIIKYKGRWVYVEQVGWVCPLEEGVNGRTYANCGGGGEKASDIVCVPTMINCAPDGKSIVSVEEKECTWYSGVPRGRVQNEDGEWCLWSCVNNKLKASDCQEMETCGIGENWSFEEKQCVKTGSELPSLPTVELLPEWVVPVLVILGFAIVGLLAVLLIGRITKKNGN